MWAALDRSVWPWDQAWYGAQTISLYEALRHHPLSWPAALVAATPAKPPAVVWIGQFFVPLGAALGSIDSSLLLSVWLCQLAALVLLFTALAGLFRGRTGAAAAGMMVVAAAPLFIALNTQYLAEASQTLAVSLFVLLMARAPAWSRPRTAALLLAATAFALLAKTTSPLYCLLPGLLVLATLLRPRPPGAAAGRGAAASAWVLAGLSAVAAAAWYAHNFGIALQHARTAAFGGLAEQYGHSDTFLHALAEWGRAAFSVAFLPAAAWMLAAVVAAGARCRLARRRAEPPGHADACAAAAFLQVGLAFGAFALSPNRDPRYVAPLLPLAAVVVAWAVRQCPRWAAPLVVALLGVQLALVHAQVLGLWPSRPALATAWMGLGPEMSLLHRDGAGARELAQIVQRTCPTGVARASHFVGVDQLHLNGHSVTYAAAKERVGGRAGECVYYSLGSRPVAEGEYLVRRDAFTYWIATDGVARPILSHERFLNESAPVLWRRLRRRGRLEPEPWTGPPGLLLFRFR